LRDEGVLYAQALQAAGIPVTLEEYPAMPHGFANFPYFNRESAQALDAITRDQRAAFA
jgi:acetyl esterase